MNKTDLVKKISEKAGLSQADSKKALEATLDAVKEALAAKDSVALVGFGTFSVSERPARQGKNPRTGEIIQIAAKNVAKFKPASSLI